MKRILPFGLLLVLASPTPVLAASFLVEKEIEETPLLVALESGNGESLKTALLSLAVQAQKLEKANDLASFYPANTPQDRIEFARIALLQEAYTRANKRSHLPSLGILSEYILATLLPAPTEEEIKKVLSSLRSRTIDDEDDIDSPIAEPGQINAVRMDAHRSMVNLAQKFLLPSEPEPVPLHEPGVPREALGDSVQPIAPSEILRPLP